MCCQNFDIKEFYDAWMFLNKHPIFIESGFEYQLWIHVVKVNPKTKEIDDNKLLNTEINVWIECLGVNGDIHDVDLDTGGRTFEEAILNLYKLVKEKYGDYK